MREGKHRLIPREKGIHTGTAGSGVPHPDLS